MNKVIVDPITRIEGHLHIETDVNDLGVITGAYSSGTMFRGIEQILQDRDPREAWAFTQRICGVCTTVHAMASIRAVENALKYPIPTNARLIRNIITATQAVQDQVVHFYQLTSPDWMDVVSALKADPAQASSLQKCLSKWHNNSTAYFAKVKSTLSKFVSAGQLGIFNNAYWGHPAYKLPPELNLVLFAHYLEALEWQREVVKVHAIFCGRNPHGNYVIGGVPCAVSTDDYGNLTPGNSSLDQDGLNLIGSLIQSMNEFVTQVHLPDLLAVARFYPDWFTRGEGLGNFLSFGDFPEDDNPSWGAKPPKLAVPSGAILWPRTATGRRLPFKDFRLADVVQSIDLNDPSEIQEFVSHSWFDYQPPAGKSTGLHPYDGQTHPNYNGPTEAYAPHKPVCDGGETLYNPGVRAEYSWLKSPRWRSQPMEVGPLARIAVLYARGDANTEALVNQSLAQVNQPLSALFSTMGRLLAEGLDTKIDADMLKGWYAQLVNNIKTGEIATHNPELFDPATWPTEASGVGFTEAPRGALGHWVKIKDKKIANYQTVVPTTWNAGPRDPDGRPGAYEAALQDGKHTLAIPGQPLEILRTIHSFNPCMACAVHVIDPRKEETLRVKVQG
jgi:hydrogenase large subunit